jgi:hypothetical protein
METPAVRATSAMVGRLRCNCLVPIEAFQTVAAKMRRLNGIIFQKVDAVALDLEIKTMTRTKFEFALPNLNDFQFLAKGLCIRIFCTLFGRSA